MGSRCTSRCDTQNIAQLMSQECCFLSHNQESGALGARTQASQPKRKSQTLPKTQFRDHRSAVAIATIAWPLSSALWLLLLQLLLNTQEAGDWTLATPHLTGTTHCTGLGRWTLPRYLLTYLTVVAHVRNE